MAGPSKRKRRLLLVGFLIAVALFLSYHAPEETLDRLPDSLKRFPEGFQAISNRLRFRRAPKFCSAAEWQKGLWAKRSPESLRALKSVTKHDGFFRAQNYTCGFPEYGCLARPVNDLKKMASYEWQTTCNMAPFDPSIIVTDMLLTGGWFFVGGEPQIWSWQQHE
jgi:hypothetical protein